MLEKHWAIVWSRVSSAHPFIISLTHEKAKPTHRPNSKRLHPQALAHMWARIRIHGAWTPSGSMAVEWWVGVGEPGRGKETGETRGERGAGPCICVLGPQPPPGARCPEQGTWKRVGRPAAARALGRPGAGCARALPAAPQARRGTPAGGSGTAGLGDAGTPSPTRGGQGSWAFQTKMRKRGRSRHLGNFSPSPGIS